MAGIAAAHGKAHSWCLCNNSALMIQYLPPLNGAPPNRGASSNPHALKQSVSDEIIVSGNLKTMKVSYFPNILCRMLVSLFQSAQNELPTESAARCSNFPKLRSSHRLKVFACRAEVSPMKQRFTLHQLILNRDVLRRGDETRLYIGALPCSRWEWAINYRYALSFHGGC